MSHLVDLFSSLPAGLDWLSREGCASDRGGFSGPHCPVDPGGQEGACSLSPSEEIWGEEIQAPGDEQRSQGIPDAGIWGPHFEKLWIK